MRLSTIVAIASVLLASAGCDSATSDNNSPFSPRNRCNQQCGDLNQGLDPCVDAPTLAACQDACLTVSPQKAEQFADCVDSYFGEDCTTKATCLSTLGVQHNASSNTSANNTSANNDSGAAECKASCDGIVADCPEYVDGALTAECKSACDQQSSDATASFVSCQTANNIFCDDVVTCYDQIGVQY